MTSGRAELPLSEVVRMETRHPLELVEVTDEFLKDIRENGILEPVEIRIISDRYVLWHGLHRVRAAQILGFEKVPAFYTR
jgi:ParB-like chromosome segregation protein Spo0J